MKITFDKYVLAAGRQAKEMPFDLRLGGKKEIQISKTIRAPTARPFDRGNLHVEVSFSVGKKCASTFEAERILLSHTGHFVPAGGALVLDLENTSNERYVLENACLQSLSSRTVGHVVFLSYIFVGAGLRIL